MSNESVPNQNDPACGQSGSADGLGGWQPIETAPKDGTRILLFFPRFRNGGTYQEFGQWELQPYNKKPNPYWSGDRERGLGVAWYRQHQPSHWMPELQPPNV